MGCKGEKNKRRRDERKGVGGQGIEKILVHAGSQSMNEWCAAALQKMAAGQSGIAGVIENRRGEVNEKGGEGQGRNGGAEVRKMDSQLRTRYIRYQQPCIGLP